MKKLIVIILTLTQIGLVFGQIKKQNIKSSITEITVFYTSAEIERYAEVSLKKGMNKLIYSDITTKIKKESIYAITPSGVDVVSINTRKKVIYPDRKRIQQMEDSISHISDRIDDIKTELIILNKSMEVLEINANYSNNSNTNVEDVIKFTEYFDAKIRKIYQAINDNNNKQNELEKVKVQTQQKLLQIKSTAVKYNGMEIELILHAKSEMNKSKLKLKYIVGGAGWTPIYKINVDKLGDALSMGFQAKVINQTGINWKSIKLAFSTSSPDKSQDTPEMKTWNLNFDNKEINEGRLDEFKTKNISKEEAKRKNNGLDVVESVKYVETNDYGINNIYKTSVLYYIPSDSKAYFIDIEEYSIPVTYSYYSVPKVDSDAFLIARITDWEKYNLLEGQTRVWFNGVFVGESYIRPQLAFDTLDISLGRDENIYVNRVKLKDTDSEKLIGTNKKQTYKYRLTVKNTNSTSVKFTLRDQLPVSQDKDIKIETITVSNAEIDNDSGSLKWNFNLKPNESREFIVAFSVRFPKEKNLRIRGTRSTSVNRSVRFL